MKRIFIASTAAIIVSFVALPAQAFTKWSTFEYKGYTVKARYIDGKLRHLDAVNPATGEAFSGHVGASGVAVIRNGAETLRINITEAEERLNSRQDLAEVQ